MRDSEEVQGKSFFSSKSATFFLRNPSETVLSNHRRVIKPPEQARNTFNHTVSEINCTPCN